MVTSQLSAQDVFSYLRPEQVNAIHNVSKVIAYQPGKVVYSQGEKATHLYVVLEGQVDLQLPGRKGFSILIESLRHGAIFGACSAFGSGTYMLTARCMVDSKILKIEAAVLRHLLDNDCVMGYALQRHLTDIYFKRYIGTMQKLQAVVMSLPVEPE
jgi:CRP-like cAMP-binding protein